MAALYIFPDTNLLMHYRRIDELNWAALSGAKDIVIVLAPAVVRELGKHKDSHPNRKLRQRARNLNSWLRELRTLQDKRLKNGVTLEVATKEPTRFLTGDLDPAVNDDRIIASALSYAADQHAVAVATDDTILLHKLDVYGVRTIEIPEAQRLPEEPDELEIEARALRRKLAEAKAREPALDLVWQATDDHVGEVAVIRPSLDHIASPTAGARDHPRIRRRHESAVSSQDPLAEPPMGLSDSAIDAYNEMLARFLRAHEAYYGHAQQIADIRRRYVALPLRMKNTANASASHIRAVVHFPDGVKILDEAPSFKLPEPPKPPDWPEPFGLARSIGLNPAMFQTPRSAPMFEAPAIYDPFAAQIGADQRTVRWSRPRLPHGPPEDLDPLHCMFAERLVGTTVRIGVEIHAEELAIPHRLELALRIEERQ